MNPRNVIDQKILEPINALREQINDKQLLEKRDSIQFGLIKSAILDLNRLQKDFYDDKKKWSKEDIIAFDNKIQNNLDIINRSMKLIDNKFKDKFPETNFDDLSKAMQKFKDNYIQESYEKFNPIIDRYVGEISTNSFNYSGEAYEKLEKAKKYLDSASHAKNIDRISEIVSEVKRLNQEIHIEAEKISSIIVNSRKDREDFKKIGFIDASNKIKSNMPSMKDNLLHANKMIKQGEEIVNKANAHFEKMQINENKKELAANKQGEKLLNIATGNVTRNRNLARPDQKKAEAARVFSHSQKENIHSESPDSSNNFTPKKSPR